MSTDDAPTPPVALHGQATPAAIAAVLLYGRRTLLAWLAGGAVVGVLAALLPTAQYRASASFITQEPTQPAPALASLAGQFGIQVPRLSGQGPDFYNELLSSREILTPLVTRAFQVRDPDGASRQASVVDLMEFEGETPEERIDRALHWMREAALASDVSRESGIVSLSFTTRWPDLSYQLATTLIEEIQAFDVQTRRTQASAEGEFLEGRVEGGRAELRASEEELQAFLQQNRQFANSTELLFRHDRLQRQVDMRQRVLTGLLDSYEQARIQEVRNTPVITLLEEPVTPPRAEPRGFVVKTLLGGVAGGAVAVLFLLGQAALRRTVDPDVERLRSAWDDATSGARDLVGLGGGPRAG